MVRVLVAGNSVALHVAPHRERREDGSYVDLLRRELEAIGGRVSSVAQQSNMIDEDDLQFMTHVQRADPDVVILHYGVNEAAPRILPKRLWMWLKGPQAYSRFKSGLRRVEAKLEPTLIRWTRAGGWIGPAEFGRRLAYKLDLVRKEAAARTLVVNIGPPSERMETLLPGMGRAVDRYNAVIEQVCRDRGAGVVDAWGLVKEAGIDIQPDGCHFTAEGHRQLFGKVRALVTP
jgi:lysophospholipase L1-like esterase